MKKLRMIITSVVVLAIVCSAFAFNAKKQWKYCYTDTYNGTCQISANGMKKTTGTPLGYQKYYYAVDWDGATCGALDHCILSANFLGD